MKNTTHDHVIVTPMPSLSGIKTAIKWLDKLDPVIRGISICGMIVFMIMVCLTFADVLLRYVFNRPLDGTIEITELMMVILVFSGIAYTQLGKAHVAIDMVTSRLKPMPQLILRGISNLLSCLLFGTIIWQSTVNALSMTESTLVFSIPVGPFAALVPLGSFLLLFVLIRDLLVDVSKGVEYGKKCLLWIPAVSLLIVGVFIWLIVYRPFDLPLPAIGILGIITMIAFFAMGMPIAFVLMGVSLIGLSYMRGMDAGFSILGNSWYRTVASYPWSPFMFFLLMGYLCFYAGLGADIFNAANRWMGHLRGGLAMGSVAACAAFGAVVGDTLSGSIAMTAIGLPEMQKRRYDDTLAIGTLTCSGTLGTLVPPSIAFILYGVLSEQSIGKLFIAGIVPALICSFFFIGVIWLQTRLNPALAPKAPESNLRERIVSLKNGGPIGILFALVIFGIYFGVFTPTEGGGIGAFCALVIALIMRRLNWKKFTDALNEAAKFTAMSFTLLGGAIMFGYLMAMSRLPSAMAEIIRDMDLPPMIVLIAILAVLCLLGCFIPAIPMILICVPIFLPLAKSFQWDLIWFGVVMVLMFNMASITPPFGINLFVMKGVTKASMGRIYRGAIPFVIGLLLSVALIVIFPGLATWLPSLF